MYIRTLPAKFRHILTVQNFYSDFLVVFGMLPLKSGVQVKDILSVIAPRPISGGPYQ